MAVTSRLVETERAARRAARSNDVPAATYSPTQSPRQYHRRRRASLPGSGWDRVFPLRYGHRNGVSDRCRPDIVEDASLEQSSGTTIASASEAKPSAY